MKRFLKFYAMSFAISMLLISCEKKPLTLDDNTSMKTLLNASDTEIKELVIKEAGEKANLSEEEINIEYILRDKKNQAIVVKSNISKQNR